MHLVVDGYGGDPELLADEAVVRSMLELYPSLLGMSVIYPPTVVRYNGPVPEDWGYSGFVMIAESHIAVHTFPARGMVWVDVFSCRPFHPQAVLTDLRARFRLKDINVTELPRGLEYLPRAATPQRQTMSG
ncbi:MAG: S-adenosylmethionine decarboxylase [Dehalococcoidia bacterium]|jgi:S-adenosylmethionine decarboxylase|nr:S-adenosylmethionine decarboxylase [Dehalococcoidia bacterium]